MTTESTNAAATVHVYWRNGCPFCESLRSDLATQEIPASWHDIWSEDGAREFVRSANDGNETVPTVAVNGRTLTNPSVEQILEARDAATPMDRERS